MSGNYPIEAVANSLLSECEDRGIQVTPMKLQKLLYLAHGYYLAVAGEPLTDEDFEAWQYGPVSPTIYHDLKDQGANFVPPGRRISYTYWNDKGGIDHSTPEVPKIDSKAWRIIDFVLDTYGAKSAVYLSDLTHKVGSPWERTKASGPIRRNMKIGNDLIGSYFRDLVN
jgi:uncharacterized phage-associated protein